MKRIFLYILSIIISSVALYSCSEDIADIPSTPNDNHSGEVALRIGEEAMGDANGSTRATYPTEDGIGGEHIKSWFVVVAQDSIIKQIIESGSLTNEITSDARYVKLDTGQTSFYAFANIKKEDIFGNNATVGSQLPKNFEHMVFNFNGNTPDNVASEKKDTVTNLFPNGIPMSCKRSVHIDSLTNSVNLNLVRLVSKIRIDLRNPTSDTVYVSSIRLSNITRDNISNIRLFPNDTISDGRRRINLVSPKSESTKEVFTYVMPSDYRMQPPGVGLDVEFYVNESQALDTFEISANRVVIRPDKSKASGVDSTVIDGHRVTVPDWTYIARNEYHKLGLNMSKYRIDIFVRPYTAIGVKPSYDNDSEISMVRLGLYGHYDIVPRIRDVSEPHTYYSMYQGRGVTYVRKQSSNTSDDFDNVDGSKTSEIQIDSLILIQYKDADTGYELGQRVAETGWGDNADGSGEVKHYPMVGWNSTAAVPRIECIVGNYTGTADYIIMAKFKERQSDGTYGNPITITRRIRISNTYRDLSQYAKPHK